MSLLSDAFFLSSRTVVEILLAGGMNVNVKTSSGTALHEAALCGKTEVVRTLLENGIDVNIRDTKSNTVLDLLEQFPGHLAHDIYSLIKSKLGYLIWHIEFLLYLFILSIYYSFLLLCCRIPSNV